MNIQKIIRGYTKVPLSEVPLFDFVGDLETRWNKIWPLFEKVLSQFKNPKILDVAMGSGQDSIFLLKRGLNVISNETEIYLDYQKQKPTHFDFVQYLIRRV